MSSQAVHTVRRMSIRGAALLSLAAGLPVAAQTTYHVAPCGDDSWTGTSGSCAAPNGPKRTIQAAINAAVNGDTVLIADGTYTGPGNRDMDFGGRAITVRSANGASVCIIDVQASEPDRHRAFTFAASEGPGSVLEGLTIRNGFMDRGGAILCLAGSSPTLRDCTFERNTAWATAVSDGGGAVFFAGGTPLLEGCLFRDNHAEAIANDPTTYAGGGAIRTASSSPVLRGCTFTHNTAAGPSLRSAGGAILFEAGAPVLTSCTFEFNACHNAGGGVWSRLGGSPTFTDCTFRGNSSDSRQVGSGGGASVSGGPSGPVQGHAIFTGCRFIENHQAANGAGIGALRTRVTVTGCTFERNTVAVGNGGGVFLANEAIATITNCLFAGGSATRGGGGLQVGLVLTTSQSVANATVINCTFHGNSSNIGGGIKVDANSAATVANSIIWANSPQQIVLGAGALATVHHSDVQGGWAGTGNIDRDPLFEGSGPHPFALSVLSRCIDAGDNSAVPMGVTTDLAGGPRFIDDPARPDTGPGAAPIVDMGAYESGACSADCDTSTGPEVLDIFDFLCFQNRFASNSPFACDCDTSTGPATCDIFDFLCFQNAFDAGCP